MNITKQQLNTIRHALTLAEYFVQGQEPSSSTFTSDRETLEQALDVLDDLNKKTYKCAVIQRICQIRTVQAHTEEEARALAIDGFDPADTKHIDIEIYDFQEIPPCNTST